MLETVSSCPIEEVMVVLSGRWPTLILYYLKDGPRRFNELRRDNPRISQRMLTLELRKLEQAGIVRRRAKDGFPRFVDYSLTDVGKSVMPLIDALGDWWESTEVDRTALSMEGSDRPRDLLAVGG